MSGHLTAGELAITAPVLVLLGVVFTQWTQRRIGRDAVETQRAVAAAAAAHQRQLAADERLWAKRAEIYPEVIKAVLERPFSGSDSLLFVDRAPSASLTYLERLAPLLNQMAAWAGPGEVSDCWADYHLAQVDLYKALIQLERLDDDEDAQEHVEQVKGFSDFASIAAGKLIGALSSELQATPGSLSTQS